MNPILINKEKGIPTLTDILNELEKPGRDPREQIETFDFDKNIKDISDLNIGIELPGIITNITKFHIKNQVSKKALTRNGAKPLLSVRFLFKNRMLISVKFFASVRFFFAK